MKTINIFVNNTFAEKLIFHTDIENEKESNENALMAYNVFANNPKACVIKNTGPAPVIGSDFDSTRESEFAFNDPHGSFYYAILTIDDKVAFVMNYEYNDNSTSALALFSSSPTFQKAE